MKLYLEREEKDHWGTVSKERKDRKERWYYPPPSPLSVGRKDLVFFSIRIGK